MQSDDSLLKTKRYLKKILSQKIAYMIKDYVKENFPEDEMMIKNMRRQIKCTNNLQVYDNKVVRSIFCGQKSCMVCNSIRLSKFLNKYLSFIEEKPYKYHMVLSIRNPNESNLKESTNNMFKFFKQSSIKRNKDFKELNKKIVFIRSFETTFNRMANTYNNHFHCLLAGENDNEVKKYGELLIEYWLKYFKDLADKKAQYLFPQEKSVLENFKYLFKVKDIDKSVIPMVYNLLKATKGKNLFLAKNIKRGEIKKELDDSKINDIKDANIIQRFNYHSKVKNWVDIETGELFISDEMIKRFPEELREHKNYLELNKFFRNNSIKIPKSFPIDFGEQLPIF